MNALAFVLHFQCFAVITLTFTLVTRYIDIRQEVHLYFQYTVTLAGFTASTTYVETETTRCITAGTGFRYASKQLTDRGEDTGVGCRVGTRGASNRALVDINHLIEMFHTADFTVGCWFGNSSSVQHSLSDRE